MVVEVFGLTDIGKKRELNEDSYRICGFENGKPLGFCVLADGMGGHNAGEVASGNAVEIIAGELEECLGEEDSDKISLNIAAAIDLANARIYEMSLHSAEQAGMGTTTVLAYIKDSLVRVANIGDSRAYVISDKEICRMTIDHSVVEQLIRSGTITREEAKTHPDKNIITRALGTEEFVDADFFDYEASEGETIILCSDGLTEMVSEDEIKECVNNAESIASAVNTLVGKANENGGTDNITVVAVRFCREGNI